MVEKTNVREVLDTGLESKSLAVRAADIVRPKIISGELPMGSVMQENDFASALNISRSSIREAFMILERDGLLVKNSNKSARIVSFSEKDIRNLYDLRSALEVACLEKCMRERLIENEILMEMSKKIWDQYMDRPENTIAWVTEDLRFHRIFVEKCNNEMISTIYQRIEYQIEMLICHYAKIAPTRFIPLYDGALHDTLINHIINNDLEKAVTFLKKHLTGTPLVMIDIMTKH